MSPVGYFYTPGVLRMRSAEKVRELTYRGDIYNIQHH